MLRLISLIFILLFSTSSFAADYSWSYSLDGSVHSSANAACSAILPVDHLVFNSDAYVTCYVTLPSDSVIPYGSASRSGDSCPAGTEYNDATGGCDAPACVAGSLSAECAVICPAQQYTYFLNGVSRRGSLGGGQVGYGQSCPQPSFPSGYDSACVGSPGSCADFDTATNEGEDVTKETTVVGSEGDTTTETTTTETQKGQDSSPSTGGGPPLDSAGGEVDPDLEGLSPDTVDVGENTYALCEGGGVVDGTIGCDYIPPVCSAGQIATFGGCIDNPTPEPPEEPATATTTTTTDPVTGDVTTTTTTTQGTDGSGTPVGEEAEEPAKIFAGGESCSVPPTCSGDALLCGIASQNWLNRCKVEQSEPELTAYEASVSSSNAVNEDGIFNFFAPGAPIDLAASVSDFTNQSGAGGSCPSDRTISLALGSYSLSYQPVCDVLILLRPLLILIFSLIGGRVVMTAFDK